MGVGCFSLCRTRDISFQAKITNFKLINFINANRGVFDPFKTAKAAV